MKLTLAAAVLVPLLWGCGADPGTSAAPPNVILIVLDTVRADSIGAYGAPGNPTPHLDAFAAGADRYASCTATAPWTLPSHASMFTGLFPFEHGSHGFEVGGMIDNVHPLHPDHRTLAEELKAVGYHTAGFAANNVYLAERYGLGQGFDTYAVEHAPSPVVLGKALEHVDRDAEQRPLFLFVNLMDAHRPYLVPDEARDEQPGADGLLEQLCKRVMNDGHGPGELGQRVAQLYSRAVSSMDQQLGLFLGELERRGVLENSIVVITSDHGEAFGTHGIVEHAKDVYEPLVSVPLLVKLPGQESGRVLAEQASLVDVAGLVARGIPGNVGALVAQTFPRLPGTHPVLAEVHFARPRDLVLYAKEFQHERTALRDGPHKLIVGGRGPELYNLERDPQEQHDQSAQDPARAAAMGRTLDDFLRRGRYRGERLRPRPLTSTNQRQMAALGYVEGDAEAGAMDAGPR